MSTENSDVAKFGSVTIWLDPLRQGESEAAQQLWDRYFLRLANLAQRELPRAARRLVAGEDVAASVFESLCNAAKNGRLNNVADREGLWRLLVAMTVRKAIDKGRHEQRLRRGGGNVRGDSAIFPDQQEFLLASADPPPEVLAELEEDFQQLLSQLDDDQMRHIAISRMNGYSVKEIAGQLGIAERTVERRLRIIRLRWQHEWKRLIGEKNEKHEDDH